MSEHRAKPESSERSLQVRVERAPKDSFTVENVPSILEGVIEEKWWDQNRLNLLVRILGSGKIAEQR